MENKYYSPELEEFCVGFEYEVLRKSPTTEEWVKFIFPKYPRVGVEWGTQDPYNIVGRITHRVKYLDKEDIESLGFDHDQTTKDGENYFKGTLLNKHEWSLWHKDGKIDLWEINDESDKCFSGILKNKSELKKLMKQLNIQ